MNRKLLCWVLVLLSFSCFANSDKADSLNPVDDKTELDPLLKDDTSISLDAIETVGDFSSIESGEDLLFEEEIFGGPGGGGGRKKKEDLSSDLTEVFNAEDSLFATGDALPVDDSFFSQLEDPLKSSDNLLGPLEEFQEDFKQDF